MNERQYQNKLIKKVNDLFPGCVIVKNDPRHIQGIPDILILYRDKWAGLEIKISSTAHIQPNQEYYVTLLNGMSFASFINPDNEEDVLNDLQHAFGFEGSTRIS
jgi:hypothetical protein